MARARSLSYPDVVAMALRHDGVEEHTWFRTPALRVGRKSFARLKEDGETLVLLVDGLDAKEHLLAARPRVFFTTAHDDGTPYVLVRLRAASEALLAPLVDEAVRLSSPRRRAAKPAPTRAETPTGKAARARRAAPPSTSRTSTTPGPAREERAATADDGPFATVQRLVALVPRGRVVTYGQLSAAVERRLTPIGAGWAVRAASDTIPWHRVVNARGGVSTDGEHPGLQRSLLEAEGVRFGDDGRIDLARYGWSPTTTRGSGRGARADRAARR